MENISKALLIAAAMLILILVLTAIVTFWDDMAAYFTSTHDATMAKQLTEFNKEFQNYNGKTIRGNQLISLMNRIIDYNNYDSGIEGHERIIITIDLKSKQTQLQDDSVEGSVRRLFKSRWIKNTTSDTTIKDISELSGTLSRDTGLTDGQLQELSANISNIAYRNIIDEHRISKLEEVLKREVETSEVDDLIEATALYNQLTQFKRAMFECKSVKHNTDTGRVNRIEFEVVLENGMIKFE